MIKVTEQGELDVYLKGTGIQFAQQLRWLFLLPIMAVVAYACHALFGSTAALVAVLCVSMSAFFWQRLVSDRQKIIASGMCRVSAGKVVHMLGQTIQDEFTHDGADARISEQGRHIQLVLLDSRQKPCVTFAGFDSRKEAEAMLACLRGKKLATRNANIRMKSS